ncbi:hypothetical protein AVEN_41102-1 [Araneus ventricosus]|uniref:Uncharacterized protein n=1 Tax=Araneus ventricosus TaxID=182803 RepID=A0A4Y2E9M5_ARAVE|nr:hypothetical protein AVEN_41102-1 [Araneus ventricosus]
MSQRNLVSRKMMLLEGLMCLSVWSKDYGISFNPKIQFREDLLQVTTLAENYFLALLARIRRATTVTKLVADHFTATGTRITLTTVLRSLHNQVFIKEECLCKSILIGNRVVPIYIGQESTLPGPNTTGPLYSSQMSPDKLWRVIQMLILREQGTGYHQFNFVERHICRRGRFMIWTRISMRDHNDLHVLHRGTLIVI